MSLSSTAEGIRRTRERTVENEEETRWYVRYPNALRLCAVRCVLSAGFAAVSVASEQRLYELARYDDARVSYALSVVTAACTAQSIFVNSTAGYCVDRYGRKPVLVAACLGSSLARALPVLRPSVRSYVAYRVLNVASLSVASTALLAMFSDIFGGRTSEAYQQCRHQRFLMMALTRTLVLRYASRWTRTRSNFVAGAILPALAAVAFACFVTETKVDSSRSKAVKTRSTNPTRSLTYFYENSRRRAVAAMILLRWYVVVVVVPSLSLSLTAHVSTTNRSAAAFRRTRITWRRHVERRRFDGPSRTASA